MGGRYVYEFKILIFFQCFHMLFMEWQEKWKGGGGDESVTRLQLFKITLKFCKTRTCRSPPLSCSSLALEVWMESGGFFLCGGLPGVPGLDGEDTAAHTCRAQWNSHVVPLLPPCSPGELCHVLHSQLTQGQHSSSILHGYLRNAEVQWFLVRRKALQEQEKSLLIPPSATTVENTATRWRLTESSGL